MFFFIYLIIFNSIIINRFQFQSILKLNIPDRNPIDVTHVRTTWTNRTSIVVSESMVSVDAAFGAVDPVAVAVAVGAVVAIRFASAEHCFFHVSQTSFHPLQCCAVEAFCTGERHITNLAIF